MTTENLVIRPAGADASCDIHEWRTDGMAARLVLEMRRKHGRGGVNACVDCIARARDDAARKVGAGVVALLASRYETSVERDNYRPRSSA